MREPTTLRGKIHDVLFGTNTPAGKIAEVNIIIFILVSIVLIILDTTPGIPEKFQPYIVFGEWLVTIIFTIEYILRLYSAHKPLKFAFSFFGIIDLLAILPSYLGLIFGGANILIIVRILRLLRIFRILELHQFVQEGGLVLEALKASRIKIFVFISFVALTSIVLGAMMYSIESDVNDKLDSLLEGIYWSLTTLTTVGYGDVVPITFGGKTLAGLVMLLGYGIIAVPVGIVTSEIANKVLLSKRVVLLSCPACGNKENSDDAKFCHICGESLV